MSGGIYLIQDDGGLVEMTEQEYASEDCCKNYLRSTRTCWPETR